MRFVVARFAVIRLGILFFVTRVAAFLDEEAALAVLFLGVTFFAGVVLTPSRLSGYSDHCPSLGRTLM
jgi:hypothetical protein